MNKIKLLIFAGSARKESFNKKLAKIAYKLAKEHQDTDAQFIDLKDYPMPIYDGDLEEEVGIPNEAKKFKELLKSSDAIIISSPEYNSSVSPLLKNALDWASRIEKGEAPLAAFKGKVASLMAASPSPLGGIRGLLQLRSILGNIKVTVLPDQVSIPQASEAFDEEDGLIDQRKKDQIKALVNKTVRSTRALKND